MSTKGIILINTGTPAEPNPEAIRAYLKAFLSDKRIVSFPNIIWQPILNAIVLPNRPKKTVIGYQHIWNEQGSPFTTYSRDIERKLKAYCYMRYKDSHDEPPLIRIAYRYSEPDMRTTLALFRDHEVTELTVLPLYPQQAFATTESVRDELERVFAALSWNPKLHFIENYYQEELYVRSLADAVTQALASTALRADQVAASTTANTDTQVVVSAATHAGTRAHIGAATDTTTRALEGTATQTSTSAIPQPDPAMQPQKFQQLDPTRTRVIFSFHSTPTKDYDRGDRYYIQTQETAAAIAKTAAIPDTLWQVAYQSRFSDTQKWIGPFLDKELQRLLNIGIKNFYIITPGFAVDCLETLYEIDYLAKKELHEVAAEKGINPEEINFCYIPALNASNAHIRILAKLLFGEIRG